MTTIITLMTDFGIRDGYVGVMKGVILGIAPEARLVDLTHLISPQRVPEAALVLDRSAPYFPPGTIHIVVVDPGVGTARRPIAAQVGEQRYVGPDNGTLTRLLARARRQGWPMEIVHLDKPRYWRSEISNVFHGRDIFAPVAAHLAIGALLTDVGTPVTDPVLFPLPAPVRSATGLRGEITHLDHFGNIGTNLSAADLAGLGDVSVRLCGQEIRGLVRTFGERDPGELIALINSVGELSVSAVNGNAGQQLNAKVGDVIEVSKL
jgi:S-adenosylmethionine hydrolase